MIYFNSKTPETSWLSNFSPHPIRDADGWRWPTAEHLFQGGKCLDPLGLQEIRNAPSPDRARQLGRKVLLRPDWGTIKLFWMERVVQYKFAQHPDLAEQLEATGTERLVHLSPWDTFWGLDPEKGGLNHLGRLLMVVREQRRSTLPQSMSQGERR